MGHFNNQSLFFLLLILYIPWELASTIHKKAFMTYGSQDNSNSISQSVYALQEQNQNIENALVFGKSQFEEINQNRGNQTKINSSRF